MSTTLECGGKTNHKLTLTVSTVSILKPLKQFSVR
jgi:hypothetical protein